ncbi:tripartite motif-containing protein 5-like isoform X1 [Eriocheir sinensis]|uniref:tripartite motif-containing protein 5-like isoform X1 n=1 Tax=Eriocheir sinensis TaxID=95602 RepID=UPI0021C633D8|nr:tripartite motif-containing protein 5-like isoform X1 [Eriocheir sinensis]XP_050723799.1 tripartite motif-containing protein 5-like isoform X1 [Eriocheir sinensis]
MSTSVSAPGSNSEGLREAMSCDVCSEVYERTLRTPLVLPCGHTFCRVCLVALKKQGNFLCPSCRAVHNNVQVEALTINFSLLNILPFCNEFTFEQCNTHGDDLRYWCCTCDLPLCSLCLYSGHPQGHTVKLAQTFVQEKKRELTEKIKLFFGNIEDQKKELRGSFNGLDALMEELFHKNACLQDKLADLTNLLDETRKASDISSVRNFEKAVKNFKCKEEDAASGTDVAEKENAKNSEPAKAKDSKLKCKEEDAASGTDVAEKENAKNSEPAKAKDSKLEEAKSVTKSLEPCQEKESSGQSSQDQDTTEAKRATIDYHDGRLLLHSLAKPDSKEISFQMPSKVFLELSVGGRCLGRVFISLWCHMRRAQQFLALCMGTMGPTLLDATASEKVRNTLVWRYVVDGDNKARTQALLTNLEWGGQYVKPDTEGYVSGIDFGNTQNSVSFGICTQSSPGVNLHAPFGRVVSGLEVVKAAFQHNPITKVTITNSGLVLPRLSL